ncbi:hypothetical protein [Streptomyces sp. NPDC048508]
MRRSPAPYTPPLPAYPDCLLCGLIDVHYGDVHNEVSVNSNNGTRNHK